MLQLTKHASFRYPEPILPDAVVEMTYSGGEGGPEFGGRHGDQRYERRQGYVYRTV